MKKEKVNMNVADVDVAKRNVVNMDVAKRDVANMNVVKEPKLGRYKKLKG